MGLVGDHINFGFCSFFLRSLMKDLSRRVISSDLF